SSCPGSPARCRTDRSAFASTCNRADHGSNRSTRADLHGIFLMRCIAFANKARGAQINLLAVGSRERRQLNRNLGEALDAACPLGIHNPAEHSRAALGDYVSIDDQRLIERSGERVAYDIAVA